ncbi:Group II intron, maturase-specific domain [Thiorhodovibrio winogradskyi]|uniref:Group II intron, maturase-specific domain n=2 Tax=Thiorhodovibrio winogradskyi TaxID=77007 RepID=A0ABZ0S9D2_9GAMM
MEKVTDLTRRELTCTPLGDVVGRVERSLRGWAGYFHFRNSSLAMSKVSSMEALKPHAIDDLLLSPEERVVLIKGESP